MKTYWGMEVFMVITVYVTAEPLASLFITITAYTTAKGSVLTSMENVVGPRMRRNSSSLELVVQHSVSSRRARPATHGSTNRAGNPAKHEACLIGTAWGKVIMQ
jgi:hypothetical protein